MVVFSYGMYSGMTVKEIKEGGGYKRKMGVGEASLWVLSILVVVIFKGVHVKFWQLEQSWKLEYCVLRENEGADCATNIV